MKIKITSFLALLIGSISTYNILTSHNEDRESVHSHSTAQDLFTANTEDVHPNLIENTKKASPPLNKKQKAKSQAPARPLSQKLLAMEEQSRSLHDQLQSLGVPQSLNSPYLTTEDRNEIYRLFKKQAALRSKIVSLKIKKITQEIDR